MEIHGFDDTIAWYDKNAEQYSENSHKINFEKSIDAFLALLPEHPTVLEAGCGTGRDARVFKDRGVEIVGIDISKGLLGVARTENSDITFIEGDLRALPLEENSFDGVWAHASLVHLETIEDAEKSLAEFFRVLKAGGFLYVLVKARQGSEKTAIVSDSLSNHNRFFRYYTPEELSELLTSAGFAQGDHQVLDDPHGREEVKWIRSVVQKPI